MSVLRMLCLAGIAATLSGPALATTYDGVADYGTATNPTGVWSYRDGSGNLLLSQDSTVVNPQWYTGGFPNGAYIVANQGASSQISSTIFYAANSLHLDGQNIGAEVRFAAPSAGIYSVSGQFEYGDTNMVTHTVKIVDDSGTTLFTYSLSNGATQSFSLPSVSLATNGYLDFITTGDGGASFAGTNLQMTVSDGAPASVPEPAPWALLGTGLLGLLASTAVRRRA